MSDSLRFYATNLVDSATITPSTVNAQFPVSNLLDYRRTKVYRSTSNSDNVVFDFGSAKDIDSFFIVNNPVQGFGVATVTLELNSTNSWGSPAFSQAITFSTQFGVGYAEFSTQNYRYARLVLTGTSGYCELSNIFIGEALQIGNDRSVNYNWNYQSRDPSKVTENRYGQKFIDILPREKGLTFSFSNLNKDELDDFFSLSDDKGIHKPFFMRLGCSDISNDIRRYSGMYFFNSVPPTTNPRFNKYQFTCSVEEAK